LTKLQNLQTFKSLRNFKNFSFTLKIFIRIYDCDFFWIWIYSFGKELADNKDDKICFSLPVVRLERFCWYVSKILE